MTRVERSIVIDRPIEEVWDYVNDPAKDVTWQSTLRESEQLTDGPVGVGTRVREVRQFLGIRVETTWEFTEYEPTSTSAIKSVAGPVPLNGRYVLEPADGGAG